MESLPKNVPKNVLPMKTMTVITLISVKQCLKQERNQTESAVSQKEVQSRVWKMTRLARRTASKQKSFELENLKKKNLQRNQSKLTTPKDRGGVSPTISVLFSLFFVALAAIGGVFSYRYYEKWRGNREASSG